MTTEQQRNFVSALKEANPWPIERDRISNMTNAQLSAAIQRLQRVCASQSSIDNPAWDRASAELSPLFTEAAKRQSEGRADGIVSL